MTSAADLRRYGTIHRRLRAQLVAAYENSGRGWPCALCDTPMTDDPTRLHLAHHDDGQHAGLAHAGCNTGDAARIGNVTRVGRHDPSPRPRTRW